MIIDQNETSEENIIQTETTAKVTQSEEKLTDITNPKNDLTDSQKDIKNNKEIAGMSYIWILSVPIYIFRKDSPFIQKHAKQGLYLFYFSLISWFLATIPYIWWIGFIMLMAYLFIITKGLLKALTGDEYYVPFLTDFLSKKNITKDINDFIPVQKENTEDVKEIISKQEKEEKETQSNISEKVHNVLDTNNQEQNNITDEHNDDLTSK